MKFFKKKYRIVEVKHDKHKFYYPQSGRLFFSGYEKYDSKGYFHGDYCYFSTEEMARQFINDRIKEDMPRIVTKIIEVE